MTIRPKKLSDYKAVYSAIILNNFVFVCTDNNANMCLLFHSYYHSVIVMHMSLLLFIHVGCVTISGFNVLRSVDVIILFEGLPLCIE